MKYLIVILTFFFVNELFAQVVQTHRYELEKENNDDFFTVLPAGELGVVIYRDTDENRGGNVLHLVSLDTALQERWNTELQIDRKLLFKGFDLSGTKMYLLFREGEFELTDGLSVNADAHHIVLHLHPQRVPAIRLEIDRQADVLALDQLGQFGRFLARLSALANFQIHVPGFGIGQRDAVKCDPGHAEMAGVDCLQLSIDEVNPQVVTLAEFELQFDRDVRKRRRINRLTRGQKL